MNSRSTARTGARNQLLTPKSTPASAIVRRTGSLTFVDANGNAVRSRQRVTPGGGDGIIAINCSPRTAEAIEASWNEIGQGDYEADPLAFEQACAEALTRVAPAFTQALEHAHAANPCILHVSGLLPSKLTGATPLDGVVNQATVNSELRALVGVAAVMGLIGFGYGSENGGRLVRAVCPLPSEATKASSQGAVDLQYHADNADLVVPSSVDPHPAPTKPMNQWQGFATIRPKRGVPMRVLAVADVIAYMWVRGWHDHVAVLQEPVFDVAAPASHGAVMGTTGVPVLVRTNSGQLVTRYHAANVTARNPHEKLALEAFGAATKACRAELTLPGRAGEVLFYQNPRSLHRREPFTPTYDGADRFYLRIYFDTLGSLSLFKSDLSTRVFR